MLTANGCFAAVLPAAVVTVGARFPIHLIVRLACPNPNEIHEVVCVVVHVEKWGGFVRGLKLKVIDREQKREREKDREKLEGKLRREKNH